MSHCLGLWFTCRRWISMLTYSASSELKYHAAWRKGAVFSCFIGVLLSQNFYTLLEIKTITTRSSEVEIVFRVTGYMAYLISAIILRPHEWCVHILGRLRSLALWHWGNYSTSVCLIFLFCKGVKDGTSLKGLLWGLSNLTNVKCRKIAWHIRSA